MDPVTHGITGALLGKGFFSKRQERVAIFAAVVGAVFPDIDMIAELFSRDPLALVKYHRSITHSFVALPLFAALLALLTPPALNWLKRRSERFRGLEAPSFAMLTLIYGTGIASHIVLDGMTSFGTRLWYPLSDARVSWDLLFIVDITFTTILLVPQVLAWIYRDPERSRKRATRMWALFTLGALTLWPLARAVGYPFQLRVVFIASAVLAIAFYGPAIRGIGFRLTRARWCQLGMLATVAYLFACGVAHHRALSSVKQFAAEHHLAVDRIGALPTPPSLLDWNDDIRAPHGVYEAQLDLRDSHPPAFRFVPDSPPDPFITRAFKLPNVRLFWHFVRFPSILSFPAGRDHVVEIGGNRLSTGRRRGPQPFTYEVVFNHRGKLLAQGWRMRGILRQHMERITRPRTGDPQPEATP